MATGEILCELDVAEVNPQTNSQITQTTQIQIERGNGSISECQGMGTELGFLTKYAFLESVQSV